MVESPKERAILGNLNSHWTRTTLPSLSAFCSYDSEYAQTILYKQHISSSLSPQQPFEHISATLKMEAVHSSETSDTLLPMHLDSMVLRYTDHFTFHLYSYQHKNCHLQQHNLSSALHNIIPYKNKHRFDHQTQRNCSAQT
jgi:hypothetical protein